MPTAVQHHALGLATACRAKTGLVTAQRKGQEQVLSSMIQIIACRAQIVRTSDTMMMTERQSVRMPDKMSETVVSPVFPLQVTALREHRDQACSGMA